MSRLKRMLHHTALALSVVFTLSAWADEQLVTPENITVDASLSNGQRQASELAARRYDTFWNTGNEVLAKAALAENFVDMTPPPGRKQGPEGPLLASRGFRTAVPDLTCDVEQMIIAGDRVISHLHFRGHFTGHFDTLQGKGQTVDFIATDIYRIENGRIAANWHIEDNLTLMKQLGAL